MSCKEFHLIKELTYSRLTAICALNPRFLPTSCADHYLTMYPVKDDEFENSYFLLYIILLTPQPKILSIKKMK